MKNRWLNTQLRIIKTAAQNFVRNAWLSVAAMAVMVITLSIVLFSVIASATFSHTIKDITDRIDVSVYLKDEVTDSQRQKLIADLEKHENIASVEYVTKEDALKSFRSQQDSETSNLSAALAEIDNPLPASLRVKPIDVNRIQELQPFLEQPEIAALSSRISYSGDRREAINNITRATQLIQRAGVAGIIIFAVVCMLIIFNTIQMAIFNRRDELTIMRLLGASTWFIRGPFIFETIYYGLASALISVAACQLLFTIASSTLQASVLGYLDINFANQFFRDNLWMILTLQLAVGIFIGAASSYIATRRYLKFKTSK